MGLDMYLTNRQYVGGQYKHCKVEGEIKVGWANKVYHAKDITEITVHVFYWRKANAIHGWFVDNIQNGEDDCEEYEVPFEKLTELKDLCLKVLESKNPNLLPPKAGFFFGSTDVDEYYWGDIKQTAEMLLKLEDDGQYFYRASW